MIPAAAGLHRDAAVRVAGVPVDQAPGVVLLLHGRGATAEDILRLGVALGGDRFAYWAPQAADRTWYPDSFLAPRERNEPWLTSALELVDSLFARLDAAGVAAARVMLLGFSQGACLGLDYTARHPRRFGAVVGLAGGLIGAPGEPLGGAASGELAGTPVFLGCGDQDPHIPVTRVLETAAHLERLGGRVTRRIYPGLGHVTNADELASVQALLADLGRPGTAAGG
jgi:predicted esterase